MTLHLRTAPYRYPAGADRLDVTRVGVDRALKAGDPAPAGAPFAPSSRILWPAKSHIDLVAALERRAAALPGSEAGAWCAVHAADLLARTEEAYRTHYIAELRVSAGLRPGSAKWGSAEDLAARGGVRPQSAAWKALLSRTDPVVLVCFCPRREPGEGQCHTCHRHHLASALAAMGTLDEGELELPPPTTAPRPPKPGPALENLVAVSGTRPPKRDASREAVAIYRAIITSVQASIAALPVESVVLHGGADGVDSAAGDAALRAGHGVVVYRPWWDAWGKAAPLVRNAYCCTAPRLLAFPSPQSIGTVHAVGLARKAGVEVVEHRAW